MEGDISTEEDRGIIPRTCSAIFERLSREDYVEHRVAYPRHVLDSTTAAVCLGRSFLPRDLQRGAV